MDPELSIEYRSAGWFTLLLVLVNLVGDGWPGRPTSGTHQFFLLPVTVLFIAGTVALLFVRDRGGSVWSPVRAVRLAFLFELVATGLFLYECRHFVAQGYRLYPAAVAVVLGVALLGLGRVAFGRMVGPVWLLGVAVGSYIAGMLLAIASFPLTYLRSDMMPVIQWADTNLLHGVSPYTTMYVGGRVYDFPYLPGMLVAYLPLVAAHLDMRFGSMLYVAGCAWLIYAMARKDRRLEVAVLLGLFILCPFLQYRHELYIPPHWFAMVLSFVLMQRRRFGWAAFVFGVGMGIYQFSWILFPFFLLNGLRRRGWGEVLKLTLIGAAGMLVMVGPFLASASKRIASNTVGQWAGSMHANSDPMNLSYWVTYAIHPDKLLRLQAVLMVVIFGYCFFRGRCGDVADTLRWMVAALTLFILCNVMVDGYFYLMLLVPMLVYTCVANGWWSEPADYVSAGRTRAVQVPS
uniref:Uncharacterized protein n=1 Tax=uncultured bacterium 162 TaxID=698381 RepID=E3T758_9BACT|nr:hypothetical protein [uncultured bacterium 162]